MKQTSLTEGRTFHSWHVCPPGVRVVHQVYLRHGLRTGALPDGVLPPHPEALDKTSLDRTTVDSEQNSPGGLVIQDGIIHLGGSSP